MSVRQAVLAALRGDPKPLADSLRERIDDERGPMSTVVQAAEAIEPIIADAVRRRPSKIGKLGLKSTHLLANLAMQDRRSNKRLSAIARGSTVGIVFIDVARFTTMTAERGDDFAIAVLTRLDSLIGRAIGPLKGECVKQLGDGFLLAFPSASRAVRGGIAIRDAVAKERRRNEEFDIKVRVAVHAGEPLIEGDDLLGHDVNLTARLLDHCRPDGVVVSEAAKELAERRLKTVRFDRRRNVKIRGLTSKVPVYYAHAAVDPARGVDRAAG